MKIFNKLINLQVKNVTRTVEQNITRRWGGGFEAMGHVVHPADNRTASQISDNLEVYAQSVPAVRNFISDLRNLSFEHKALVSDVVERANSTAMLMTDIRLTAIDPKTGKSHLENLLGDIIYASKNNPYALSFLQQVLNNTDLSAAKYSLFSMSGGILKNTALAKHFAAAKSAIPMIAEQTLSGGYLGTFEKEQNFINFIKVLINPSAKPQNIELLNELKKTVEPLKNLKNIFLDTFVNSDVPVEKIKDNISTLPAVNEMFVHSGKLFDVNEFLAKNVNLY